MSHFSVLVISETPLNVANIAPIMQPFHEFECTGIEDEYVTDVDVTDQVIEEFKTAVNAGTAYASLTECAKDYFGAFERDGRFYNKTNPNAHWDWWQIGGRWSGLIKLRREVIDTVRLIKDMQIANTPIPDTMLAAVTGIEHGSLSWTNSDEKMGDDRCDIALKRQIDFEVLRAEAAKKATISWMQSHKVIAGRDFETWEEVVSRYDMATNGDAAREFYHGQQVVADLRAAKLVGMWDVDDKLQKLKKPIGEAIAAARRSAFQTFAVIKDGQWYERGSMGWFGLVSDEKEEDTWSVEFEKLLDDLAPDTCLAVVDCHI